MSVTYKRPGWFWPKHHKSPSGLNNKVRFLLRESKRNINNVHYIVKHCLVIKGYDSWRSWLAAEDRALEIIKTRKE